jgi:hypothetical protein
LTNAGDATTANNHWGRLYAGPRNRWGHKIMYTYKNTHKREKNANMSNINCDRSPELKIAKIE